MSDIHSLITRAEALLTRLEAVLPHALEAPDWAAAIAFRYRKRAGSGRIEPVRHIAPIRLDPCAAEMVQAEFPILDSLHRFGEPDQSVSPTMRGGGLRALLAASRVPAAKGQPDVVLKPRFA